MTLNKKNIQKNLKWITIAILALIFLALYIGIHTGKIQILDDAVYQFIKEIRNDNLTNILKIITNLGGTLSLITITVVTSAILIFLKKKKLAICIILNLLISSFTYFILKNIIARPRPPVEERLIEESGFSFPSGHSTNNTVFYGFVIYLIYKNVKNKLLRNILCVICTILILAIGFSRVYLRVHYPSDVLAGFCLGIIIVIILETFIYKKIKD